MWGVLLLILFVFSVLSIFSYNWKDISFLHADGQTPPSNLIGLVGAWLSFLLFSLFGVGAYLTPVWCLVCGIIFIVHREGRVWPRITWCSAMLLALGLIPELYPDQWAPVRTHLNIGDATSGFLGTILMKGFLIKWLSPVGTGIMTWSVFIVSLIMLVEMRNMAKLSLSFAAAIASFKEKTNEFINSRQDRRQLIDKENRDIEKRRKQLEESIRKEEIRRQHLRQEEVKSRPAPEPKQAPVQEPATASAPAEESGFLKAAKELLPKKMMQAKKEKPAEREVAAPREDLSGYQLPPISLLDSIQLSSGKEITVDTGLTSKILVETLKEFGIETEVTNVEKGPVVTRYELLPAPGIRVERIASLANNLALSLKATNVRVQAPIPGKGVVGIEVPNATAKTVGIREIIEGEKWDTNRAKLPLVLGKNVGGEDIIADLADMPHLLIAGATGAGKTVCMNSVLAGLLMARRPDEMRLLLVDPKIVEFSVYANLPHLVVPVITNPKKVAIGLRWAINEMEKRYKLFARVGVRNIEGFNNRPVVKQEDMFATQNTGAEKENKIPARVPYIVIVIDELADLMLADQAEIENCVARLAQLSRAVGIHMILSTQRPSVNVITGTIKANFPARIAFQVAQKVDSRTILDAIGAEKLLGRGDMLYQPPGSSKVVRAQGAMTTDDEIKRIVAFIKEQAGPEFEMEIHEKIEKPGNTTMSDEEDDDLLTQATEIIRETQRASTSSLQRRLRIGYTRAARIMDILEERGIVGPPRGSDPREILIDLDSNMSQNAAGNDDLDFGNNQEQEDKPTETEE